MPLAASGETLVVNALLASVYVALYVGDPLGAGVEVSGGSYTRQAMAFTNAGSNPTIASNTADVTFPTASADWGAITHFALFDALAAGNMRAGNNMTTPKTVSAGDTCRFPVGTLVVSAD